jgi:hypothetical protein
LRPAFQQQIQLPLYLTAILNRAQLKSETPKENVTAAVTAVTALIQEYLLASCIRQPRALQHTQRGHFPTATTQQPSQSINQPSNINQSTQRFSTASTSLGISQHKFIFILNTIKFTLLRQLVVVEKSVPRKESLSIKTIANKKQPR